MIAIHDTTLRLLHMMYNQDQLEEVLNYIAISQLQTMGEPGYPFMVLQFGKDPPPMIEVQDPPESYIWN